MAHTPRRSRTPDPPQTILTNDQIAEAMGRALTLRRKTACNPEDVTSQAMSADDAVQSTLRWRQHMRFYRWRWTVDPHTDPWYRIGWIHQLTPWPFITPLGRDHFDQTWDVWLNITDRSIHLRYERGTNWPDENDPYR